MKASHVGAILIIIGVLALLSGLGLDINICGLLFAFALLYFGFRMLVMNRSEAKDAQSFVIPSSEATRAKVQINHGLGKLQVFAGRVADIVVEGKITRGGDPEAELRGDEVKATIGTIEDAWPEILVPWKWEPYHWDLGLSTTLPTELEVTSGLSDIHLDLSQIKLTKLKLNYGLGSATVTMPGAAGYTKADIDTGLSSLDVIIPPGVAARIKVDGLGSTNVSKRFPNNGKFFQSPDYEVAANKIDLEIDYGLGSVTVK